MISFNNVSLSFQDQSAILTDLSLNIKEGECVLICGQSGSGKSSITRIINGVIPDYIEGKLSGSVQILGLDKKTVSINDLVPLSGSVFQNPKTQHFATETNHELSLVSENLGISPVTIHDRIDKLIDQFNAHSLLNRSIFNLSGGEKQQLAFLSTLVHHPKIIILDEVTANLDQNAIHKISAMIEILKEAGNTIILTEHRLTWSLPFVDRYLLLENGSISKEWSNEEFQQLDVDLLHELGLRTHHLSPIKEKIKNIPQATFQSGAPLSVHNLSIGYDAPLMDPLNFSFQSGKIVGILGKNGIGKTTLSHTLAGLLKPLSGNILWQGEQQTPHDLMNKTFMVMQDTNYQLFTESVQEEIEFGIDTIATDSDDILKVMKLNNKKEQHPMTLSGGEKQRLVIASAIQSQKPIIIYDEPTSGLDYYHMQAFGNQMKCLAQKGVIQIIITHDEELVAHFCDQIIQLNQFIR